MSLSIARYGAAGVSYRSLRPTAQPRCGRSSRRWRETGVQFSRPQRQQLSVMAAASDEGAETEADSESKDGTEMATKLKEIAALDKLVNLFLTAKSKDELVKLVGENILALNQDFWLRMASRSDTGDAKTKEKIAALSKAVMTITETLIKMTESQLDESSELLTEILTAAADKEGHWDLPLAPDRLESLKQALNKHKDSLDEAFLSTAFALIRKSAEDNIEGMIPLMQRMLQLYAAQVLREDTVDPTVLFLNDLLAEDSETWSSRIMAASKQGLLTPDAFSSYIETKLASTIELVGGSYAQRVQVEFLTKLKQEGEAAFAPSMDTTTESEQTSEL